MLHLSMYSRETFHITQNYNIYYSTSPPLTSLPHFSPFYQSHHRIVLIRLLPNRGGYIVDSCSAGYFCLAGSEDYTPVNMVPDPVTRLCVPNTFCSGPCPSGFYCLGFLSLSFPTSLLLSRFPLNLSLSPSLTLPAFIF